MRPMQNFGNIKKLSLALSATFLVGAAGAADLLQVYRQALDSDPLFQSARFTQDAGREKESQGLAGLLPTIGVSGNTQWNDVDREMRVRI
jgi:outer membrane protein